MKRKAIEELTRKALSNIAICNKNKALSETDNSMEYIYASDDNYKAFLEALDELNKAVEIQKQFDNLTNLRNQAHFKMKRAQYSDHLMEHAQYQSEVNLYDKKIEELKTK